MRRSRAVAAAVLALGLAAAGCAVPAGAAGPGGPPAPRWEISRKPYSADGSDVTLLLDRETGEVWRYDWDSAAWIPVPRAAAR